LVPPLFGGNLLPNGGIFEPSKGKGTYVFTDAKLLGDESIELRQSECLEVINSEKRKIIIEQSGITGSTAKVIASF